MFFFVFLPGDGEAKARDSAGEACDRFWRPIPGKGLTAAKATGARSGVAAGPEDANGKAYTCVEWALANAVPTGTGGSTAKAILCA